MAVSVQTIRMSAGAVRVSSPRSEATAPFSHARRFGPPVNLFSLADDSKLPLLILNVHLNSVGREPRTAASGCVGEFIEPVF